MLIGITGKAGSGKDTVGDYLCQKGFGKTAFAATLKNMLAVAGMPEPDNRDDKEKVVDGFNFTWREAAQKLGTEWGRSLDENIWLKLSLSRIDNALKSGDNIVVTDVRFDNEAKVIRERGGVILHLRGRQVELGENSGHASEAGVKVVIGDWIIENTGSLEELYKEVDRFIECASEDLE